MYLIIGLGNPGSKYYNTRHNIGFTAVDTLAEFFKIESFILEDNYLYAEANYKDKQVVLMKPLTYMNASGKAVKGFYSKYEVKLENILIVYDDINLDFGVLRTRPSGSDGGQNGIKSIIYEMETHEIPRLRIGVWNDKEFEKTKNDQGYDLADFVLSDFVESETKEMDKLTGAVKDAVLSFVEYGVTETMNNFNKRVLETTDNSKNTDSTNTTDFKGENNN